MPRPPKRISPQAHKTANHPTEDGRPFKKGRFAATTGHPTMAPLPETEATVVDVGREDTATLNAAFTPVPVRPAQGEAPQPQKGRGSKYDARPTAASAPVGGASGRQQVTVHLTGHEERANLVVIDLTKLPPVDPDSGSETFYIRHSDGWPTKTD